MSKMRFYQVCLWLENNCLTNHIDALAIHVEREEGGMRWIKPSIVEHQIGSIAFRKMECIVPTQVEYSHTINL